MVNTSTHPVLVDGVRLDTYAYNIETKTGWDLGQSARGSNQEVPGMDGELWTPNKRESAGRLALSMWVSGANEDGVNGSDGYATFRANLDFLRFMFGVRYRLLTVQIQYGGSIGTREIRAEVVQAFDPTMLGSGRYGRFTVMMNCPEVYWRDTSDQNYDLTSATTGTKILSPFAGATANMRDLQIVFDGPWTNPSITDDATGHTLQLSGTVAAGSQWMVNTTTHTSKTGAGIAFTSGGTQAMLQTTRSGAHSPGLFGISPAGTLNPTITLGGSGTAAGSRVRIRGRRKYR